MYAFFIDHIGEIPILTFDDDICLVIIDGEHLCKVFQEENQDFDLFLLNKVTSFIESIG